MGRPIWEINDPDERFQKVFALASDVYPEDPDYVDAFMYSGIRGAEAQELGAEDNATFITPGDMVMNGDCQRVVEYLNKKLASMEPL